MTVGNENYIAQVILSSATQVLPSTYYFLKDTDIFISSDGRGTLVLGTDYTVQLPEEEGEEGSFTMIAGIVGETITHINCPPCTQLIDFVENDRFPAALQEKGLDKLTMLVCKLRGDFDTRAIQYPVGEIGTSPFVPIKIDRTGAQVLFGWDPIAGDPIGVSPGSLNLNLLLLTDSDLGGATPSNLNGATQQAIKLYVDAGDLALQTEVDAMETALCLNADGTFNTTPYAGTNFLTGATSLCTAFVSLDTQVNTNKTDIATLVAAVALNTSALALLNPFLANLQTILVGNTLIPVPLSFNLALGPFNIPASHSVVFIHAEMIQFANDRDTALRIHSQGGEIVNIVRQRAQFAPVVQAAPLAVSLTAGRTIQIDTLDLELPGGNVDYVVRMLGSM